jgi:flagellar assembly protein FliH
MGAPAKFMFDMDFSAGSRDRAASSAEIAQRIAEAEARAYREGAAAARNEAAAEAARSHALALSGISVAMDAIAARYADVETRMETEAVEVATAVARKLCTELLAREPMAEIAALVGDCFRHLVSTPHLVVRINEAMYEQASKEIERLAKQSGFSGKLVILAEPDVASGDCRIEWADGGVVRARADIDAKIEELVERYMASKGLKPIDLAGKEPT